MLKDKWLCLIKEVFIMHVGLSEEQIVLIFFFTKNNKRNTFSKANS